MSLECYGYAAKVICVGREGGGCGRGERGLVGFGFQVMFSGKIICLWCVV